MEKMQIREEAVVKFVSAPTTLLSQGAEGVNFRLKFRDFSLVISLVPNVS